ARANRSRKGIASGTTTSRNRAAPAAARQRVTTGPPGGQGGHKVRRPPQGMLPPRSSQADSRLFLLVPVFGLFLIFGLFHLVPPALLLLSLALLGLLRRLGLGLGPRAAEPRLDRGRGRFHRQRRRVVAVVKADEQPVVGGQEEAVGQLVGDR